MEPVVPLLKGITDGRFMSWLLWKSLKDDYLSEVEILQDLRAAPEPLVEEEETCCSSFSPCSNFEPLSDGHHVGPRLARRLALDWRLDGHPPSCCSFIERTNHRRPPAEIRLLLRTLLSPRQCSQPGPRLARHLRFCSLRPSRGRV